MVSSSAGWAPPRRARSAGDGAVAAVLIGSSLADFARDTATGRAVVGGSTPRVLLSVALGIAVAAAFVPAVAGVRVLVPALLPVAVGYQLAHLFAPLLVEGQVAAGQIATAVVEGPAAQAQLVADYTILPGTLAALLQLAGFLLPHLIAGHVAATLAVDRYGSANAGRALVGFRVLLVLSAWAVPRCATEPRDGRAVARRAARAGRSGDRGGPAGVGRVLVALPAAAA